MKIHEFDLQDVLKEQECKGGYAYLAAPYSDPDIAIRLQRVDNINRVAGHLIAAGVMLFSPISHGHPIAMTVELPTDYAFWQRHAECMLHGASSIIILQLGGWAASEGITGEVEFADTLDLTVYVLDPLKALSL